MNLRALEQTIHEIAMATGNSLVMETMLQEALSTYLTRLSCMAAEVFAARPWEGGAQFRSIFRLPRRPLPGGVVEEASRLVPGQVKAGDLDPFLSDMPVHSEHDGVHRYLFELPGFGLLLVLRSDEAFSRPMLESLFALHRKLARACLSCMRSEDARLANTRLRQEMLQRAMTEEKYRSIFENAVEGIFQSTPEGRLLEVNPAMAKMLGYASPAQMLREVLRLEEDLYVHPQDRRRLLAAFLRQDRVTAFEVPYRRRDGSVIWVSLSGRIVRDETGRPLRLEGLCEDATQRKATLQALENAKNEAERLSLMKSNFLTLVSHELRTPMTSILGFSSLIKKRIERKVLPAVQGDSAGKALEDVLGNLDIIVMESNRLSELINNTLDLARLESGQFVWDVVRFEVPALMAHALRSSEVLFSQKGLALQRRIPERLPLAVGDYNRLLQVLINLLSNAVKFTPAGTVTCAVAQEDGLLRFSVTDTGIGIPNADKDIIFDKFKQLGDTLTDKPRGSGLGLPICKEIVEWHGGRLWVEDAPGGGSIFCFTLPLTPPDHVLAQLPDHRDAAAPPLPDSES
ncbi:sensor histidine kinase [Megalodesulfovibrio gigas]|nr:PAS domain-containing sensor histidine kinase [Megalodesulfovibrio gigas]